MKKTAILASFLGIWAASRSTAQEAATGSLEVQVVNSVTGTPVKGVSLTLYGRPPLSPGSTYSATSNGDGKALFTGLPTGTYFVFDAKVEHYFFRGIASPGGLPIEFTVHASERSLGGKIPIEPDGVIEGRVLDADGDPLVGVSVETLSYDNSSAGRRRVPQSHATTNDLGEYRIFDIQPGRYLLRASAVLLNSKLGRDASRAGKPNEGYATVYYPSGSESSQVPQVEIAPGANSSQMDLRMRKVPMFQIRGQLTGANGQMSGGPVSDLTLRTCDADGYSRDTPHWDRSLPNAAGDFVFPAVASGTYCLTYEEYAPTAEYVHEAGRLNRFAKELVVVTDRDINGLQLNVATPGPVEGITRVDGKPVKTTNFVALDAFPNFYGYHGSRDSDDAGRFSFASVPSDRYQVYTIPGLHMYLKSIHFNDRDISNGILEVPPGGGTLLLDFKTGDGGVKGKVDASTGQPVAGLSVTLAPEGPLSTREDIRRQLVTNQNGEFEFSWLPPGSYHALVWGEYPGTISNLPEFQARFFSRSPEIRLSEGEHVSVAVKVIPAEEIRSVMRSF